MPPPAPEPPPPSCPAPDPAPAIPGTCRPNDRRKRRTLRLALILTASILIVEVVGGLLSNSLALLSDAGHVAADAFSLALALIALRIACQPATPKATFGYHRVEILAALVNGMLLVVISVMIFREAYERLLEPPTIQSTPLLIAAVIGFGVNLFVVLKLHSEGDHAHDLNIRGAYLHVMGDTLASVSVIIGGIIIWLTGFTLIDPILGFGIGGIIIIGAVRLIREGVTILLGWAPKHIDFDALVADLNNWPGIRDVHDVHIWTLCSAIHALSAHVLVANDMTVAETQRIQTQIATMLEERYSIRHCTLQFETQHCGRTAICDIPH